MTDDRGKLKSVFFQLTGARTLAPRGHSWYRRLRKPWGVLFSLNDGGSIRAGERSFPVPEGALLVYKPDYLYEFTAVKDWEYFWFHYPLRSHMIGQLDFDETLPGLGSLTFSGEDRARITGELDEVCQLEKTRRPGWEALAMLLVESVLQRFSYHQKYGNKLQHRRIEKAVSLLCSDKLLRMGEIAAACGWSIPMFYAVFRQEMGCSPRAYREQFLLRRGKTLLLNSTLGIDEIAEACGMCDRYYFSNRFKKVYGVSPAAFRRGEEPQT